MNTPTPRDMWEQRYGAAEYIYGTEPNDFLRTSVDGFTPGRALCYADGEGRNSVFLAEQGWQVSAIDLTESGVAKTHRLAAERGVTVDAQVADLADYDPGESQWDLIVSIFAHTPPPIRTRVHNAIATALAPGGHLVLEAYTPDQIGRGTGGPPVPELTMTLDELRRDITGLELVHAAELERPVVEGPGHTGVGAVVQVIARRAD
jgi:SAM-dependent methyltransferase